MGCDLDRALAHLAVAVDLPAEPAARGLPAALEAARAPCEAGDLDAADRAIERGRKLSDPNGWLYLERAQLERLRSHPEQLPRIFEIYGRKLAEDADEIAGVVAFPPPENELAFHELMARA